MREKVSTSVDMPLSNEGKRVLGYAAEEAERLVAPTYRDRAFVAGTAARRKIVRGTAPQRTWHSALAECGKNWPAKAHESSAPTSVRQPTSLLTQNFADSLTQSASEEQLSSLIGREEEFDRIVQVLGRSTKNNPVLVGKRGSREKDDRRRNWCSVLRTGRPPLSLDGKLIIAHRSVFNRGCCPAQRAIKRISQGHGG